MKLDNQMLEVIKFITGILFCMIAFFSASLFFYGYIVERDNWHATTWIRTWSNYGASAGYTPIYLAVFATCGAYLLTHTRFKD